MNGYFDMQIIDRYLIRQFVRVFVMIFLSLFGIFIIGEFVTNFSEFMDYRGATENFGKALLAYYGARLPMFFELAGHIVALLSAVLAVSWMQRHNELTALQAAGISRWRIVKPLVIATMVVAVLGAVNREFWIPAVRDLLVHNIGDIVSERSETLTPHYDNMTNILFDGDTVNVANGEIEDASLRLPFAWHKIGFSLRANRATYRMPEGAIPGGYLLTDVVPPVREAESVVSEDGRAIIFAPGDHSWLNENECFVVSDLRPDVLRGNHRWQQYGSTSQLINSLRDKSAYHSPLMEITLHNRFVRPLLDVSLVFFGLPIALSAQRRYIFAGAAKSLLAVIFFSLVVVVCHGLGAQTMVSPATAAWLPVLILIPAAVLFSAAMTG